MEGEIRNCLKTYFNLVFCKWLILQLYQRPNLYMKPPFQYSKRPLWSAFKSRNLWIRYIVTAVPKHPEHSGKEKCTFVPSKLCGSKLSLDPAGTDFPRLASRSLAAGAREGVHASSVQDVIWYFWTLLTKWWIFCILPLNIDFWGIFMMLQSL